MELTVVGFLKTENPAPYGTPTFKREEAGKKKNY